VVFRKIIKWLSDDDAPGAKATPSGLSAVTAESYVVLRRALANHCPLTVYVGKRPEAYSSAILEILPEKRVLMLDELTPAPSHGRLAKGDVLHIRAIVDGVQLQFDSTVTELGVQDGLPYYRASFPSRIDYPQRRRQYRVTVPMNRGLQIYFDFARNHRLVGELRDISMGGLCARITSGHLDEGADQPRTASCRIMLPDNQSIVTEVELVHIDAPQQRARVARVRARFLNLSAAAERRVSQLCAEIERMQRQRR